MPGWNLNSGELIKEDVTEDDLWKIFNYLFSTKSVNKTSYKFAFIKALIERVFELDKNNEINLDELFKSMARIYWNLMVKYKLNQIHKGQSSSITKLFHFYIEENPEIKLCEYDNLKSDIKKCIEKEICSIAKKYVVGAIYGDTKGILYGFSKKSNIVKYSKSAKDFLIKYNRTLLKLDYFEWILFLEKVNSTENCYAIASKLEEASKRSDLSIYRDFMYYHMQDKKCFYCEKDLTSNEIHVDHVIPWSFIKSDKLWNLVLSCPKCNQRKSDKLSELKFIEKLQVRNENLIISNNEFVFSEFKTYEPEKVDLYYKSALFNGFKQISMNEIKAKEIVENIKKCMSNSRLK